MIGAVGAAVGHDLAVHVTGHGFLVDADVIAPGTDDGTVGAGQGGHAAVGATVDLELEFVGPSRTVHLVLILLSQGVADVLGVDASKLTASLAHAAGRGPQSGTGAAQVPTLLGQLGEDGLQLLGKGAQKHHVAGGAVHVEHARTTVVPDLHDLAQALGLVELGRGLVHAQGVEVLHAGEQVGHVGVTADDAAAVSQNAHDTAVLPVALLVFVGELELPQEVGTGFITGFRRFFDIRNEARPRPLSQLVEHRSVMHFSHEKKPP
jgi:hypothetical protein